MTAITQAHFLVNETQVLGSEIPTLNFLLRSLGTTSARIEWN